MPGIGARLMWCAPAVFVIGVAALASSWTLFYIYHPDGFVGTLPSISETISTTPGSIAFQSLMCVVTPCIVVTWLLNFFATRSGLATLAAAGRPVALASALNLAACVVGILAGFLLAALAAIRLHDGDIAHEWHIWLSEGFYSTQVVSFLIDASCAVVRRGKTSTSAQSRSLRARLAVGFAAIIMSLVFLYLYVSREIVPGDPLLSQGIYVACEYTLATLCFAYPMAAYPELRAYYGSIREEAPA